MLLNENEMNTHNFEVSRIKLNNITLSYSKASLLVLILSARSAVELQITVAALYEISTHS